MSSAVVRFPLLAAGLLCAIAAAQEELAPEAQRALESALAGPLQERYDELFDAEQFRRGGVGAVLTALDADAGDAARDPEARDRARWVASFVAWRDGRLEEALARLDAMEGANAGPRVPLRRAQLLDALGRIEDARAAYEAALAAAEGADEQLEGELRLRLAILRSQGADAEAGGGPEVLIEFAKEEGRDPALRNRAANVLALTGHPAQALELFVLDPEDPRRSLDEVRLATWAIRAKKADRAQELAWQARASAPVARDRFYALSILVEAHRLDDSLEKLLERFAAEPALDEASRQVWIDLLRELGRVEEAERLLREGREGFSLEMQRALVEMYRESGQEERMVATYRELIAAQPEQLTWREGLTRHHLERGDAASARALWDEWLRDDAHRDSFLLAARALGGLGLDDLAEVAAEACLRLGVDRDPAYFFLFQLRFDRGRQEDAEEVLERLDAVAQPDDKVRAQLAECYEQLGKLERAVEILEGLRAARGTEQLAEDLEMRLAWLYSEVGREETALERWSELWRHIQSVPRRRYVEDRLMTVAARLGRLADLVVDLEAKLAAGTVEERESALLVRLYTKVNDPVSATEVLDEYFARSGGAKDPVEGLLEKGRVYLACTDYASYEEILRELMRIDPAGEGEHLRSLVMSQLERGRPDEARDSLERLKTLEPGEDSAEFEAGVLGLAGLRDDAIAAYRRGIARDPGRIEIYLLLANLMREVGATQQAIGIFQHLAETAEKDDLFTIAIDGLLNMEAPAPVLDWARRITLERMARGQDRMYLYQLLADLAEERGEPERVLDALEGSLLIAGPRRASILRELMDRTRAPRGATQRVERHLSYGRRLISLDEVVPPEVYLDLGQAFLDAGEVRNAVKTFDLARDVPDPDGFERQVAERLEIAGYALQARRTYESVLIRNPGDVGLLIKVAEIEEQLGRDGVARELYARSLDHLLQRSNLSTEKAAVPAEEERRYFAANVDEYDLFSLPALVGLLVTLPESEADETLARLRGELDAGIEEARRRLGGAALEALAKHPRLQRLSDVLRRLSFSFDRPELAEDLDLHLLAAFPQDERLLARLCRERLDRGLVGATRRLLDAAPREEAQKTALRYLVGSAGLETAGLVPVAQAAGLVVPLLVEGDADAVDLLLLKADLAAATAEDIDHVRVLFSAALLRDNEDATLRLARQWMRAMLQDPGASYRVPQLFFQVRPLLRPELQRSLLQFLVAAIVEDLDRARNLLRFLPELQRLSEEPILDPEQAQELLEKQRLDYPYGLGPLLALLPLEEQASAVRGLWPKVPQTSRVRFLLTIASEYTDPMPREMAEFLVEALEPSLREDDEKFLFYRYLFDQLLLNEKNAELAVGLAAAAERVRPQETVPRLVRAASLLRLGQVEEGVAKARELLRLRVQEPDLGEWRQTLSQLADKFLPEHAEALLAELDTIEEPSLNITQRRLELVARCNDPALRLRESEAAVRRHPEDRSLVLRWSRELGSAGRRSEARKVLEEFLVAHPKDGSIRVQLARLWEQLDHPLNQLEYSPASTPSAEAPAADAEVGAATSPVRLQSSTATVVIPAARVMRLQGAAGVVSGVATARNAAPAQGAAQDRDPDKLAPPSVGAVKEALDAEKLDQARLEFRRFWRFGGARLSGQLALRVAQGLVNLGRAWGGGNPPWPEDDAEEPKTDADAAAESEEVEKPAAKGGLFAYEEYAPPAAEELPSTYEVLAAHPFAAEEMRRQIRSTDPRGWDAIRFALDAANHALVAEKGAAAVFDETCAIIRAGRAGKLEHLRLLDLLTAGAVEPDAELPALLDDLVRTMQPTNGSELLRLARVLEELGQHERALRLYHWCATLVERQAFGAVPGSLDPREMVEEVARVLTGDEQLAVAARILDFARPSDPNYQLEQYEILVLDTWQELLPPAAALDRSREVAEGTADVTHGLRRNAALRAAEVLARGGAHESAIACLEVGLCILPTEGLHLANAYQLTLYRRPGYFSRVHFAKLFPRQLEGWQEPAGWFRAVGAALATWIAEERVQPAAAFQAACLAVLRLHELGDDAGATALAEQLAGLSVDASDRLWLADAARAAGAKELAFGIERSQLDQGELPVARIAEVIAEIATTDAATAALAAGAKAAEYTLHPRLLATLAELSAAEGDADAETAWKELDTRAQEARAEFRERRRRAAEAAKKAQEEARAAR